MSQRLREGVECDAFHLNRILVSGEMCICASASKAHLPRLIRNRQIVQFHAMFFGVAGQDGKIPRLRLDGDHAGAGLREFSKNAVDADIGADIHEHAVVTDQIPIQGQLVIFPASSAFDVARNDRLFRANFKLEANAIIPEREGFGCH